MRPFNVLLLAIALGSITISAFGQGGSPIVVRYGTGCDADLTAVTGLNDRGEIAGYIGFGVPQRGFIYRNGNFFVSEYQKAHSPSGGTMLFGINNRGQAVGWFLDTLPVRSVNIVKALLLDSSGTYHVIPPPPGEIYAPVAINDKGDTGGWCGSDKAIGPYPCVRTRAGKYFRISKPPAFSGYEDLTIVGINNRGLVAANLSSAGETSTALLTSATGPSTVFNCRLNGQPVNTRVTGINNKGQVIGFCSVKVNSSVPFVRDAQGRITLLQSPVSPGAFYDDINDHGDAIGNVYFGAPGQICEQGFFVPNVSH